MPAASVPPTADSREATLWRLLRIAWSYRSDCLQLLGLQLVVVFLTVAVIAAVMLTLRRRTGLKTQNPSEQTMVKGHDRLRVVKMDAEKPVVHTNIKPSSNEEAQP